MAIPGIITKTFVKTLSGLGNNSDSIVPMAVKDTISNCAIVHTYKKEGGVDDAREKTIEEFGTGAVWLFGIPAVKTLIDKFVYPAFGLKPELDPRLLDENKLKEAKDLLKNSPNPALNGQKEVFNSLGEKCKFLKKFELPFSNKQMYKGMFVGKFAVATMLSAFALSKIIKYKQKTTENRIKKDFYKNNASRILMSGKIKQNDIYGQFCGAKKEKKEVSFGSSSASAILRDFMYNPIKNTSILDGVITGTRLLEARDGEKKEVFLKEAFQILFIYGLAQPLQKGFEAIGNALKKPIELDPQVIFDKDIAQKLESSKDKIKELKASKNLLSDIYALDPKSAIVELLSKNGSIATLKNKKGEIEAISHFNVIKQGELKDALNHLESLSENIGNLKGIKAFKTIAVFGNVAIAAWAMGVLQPKVNILMRKMLNNGDNRNQAIVQQEKALLAAHQG